MINKSLKILSKANIWLGTLLIVVPVILLIGDSIITNNSGTVFATDAEKEKEILSRSFVRANSDVAQEIEDRREQIELEHSQSDFDIDKYYTIDVPETEVLTYGNRLIVESIGIDTVIYESKNIDAALDQGVWRFPEYGNPVTAEQPIFLGAHRWGRAGLSNEFRNKNLFINLPSIKDGDIIKIIWDGETYQYRVTHVAVNEYVDRISDLVLLTCQDFNTTERIFVYAEKI